MKRIRRKTADYIPVPGFYDLRDFDIPDKEFLNLWSIQEYLAKCERMRKEGKYKDMPNQLNEVKNLSAQYQHTLFSYKLKNALNFAV